MKGAFVSVFLFALWDNGLTLQCWRVSSPGQQPAFWARYPAERGSAGSGTPGLQSRAPVLSPFLYENYVSKNT